VPAKAAWQVGSEVAEGVLERHHSENDEYPEEIGVVAWGTPTVRTRGETIAQVLAMMGVEPQWTDAGRIDDVEPIPLEELDRPRIDVTTRVSGLFRDAFPAAAGVIHDAVDAVVDLDEPHEMNYIKKHVEAEQADLEEEEGLDESDARTAAKHRVFTTRPEAMVPGRTRPSTRATGTTARTSPRCTSSGAATPWAREAASRTPTHPSSAGSLPSTRRSRSRTRWSKTSSTPRTGTPSTAASSPP